MKKVILFVALVVATTAFTVVAFNLTDEGKAMYEMLTNSALKQKVEKISKDDVLISMLKDANSIKVLDQNGKFWVRKPKENGGNNLVIRTNHKSKTVEVFLKENSVESSLRTYKFSKSEWEALMNIGLAIQKSTEPKR